MGFQRESAMKAKRETKESEAKVKALMSQLDASETKIEELLILQNNNEKELLFLESRN